MRVALIGPVYPYRGGIAHYTTMLARALREGGHDLLLVSFARQYPQWLFPGRSDKDPSKSPMEAGDVRYWIDSLNPVTWLTTFWRILKYSPDAIVLQWWTSFWAPVWFVLGATNRLLRQTPVIYICHNVLPHEARQWDPWLARLALRWGDRFIVQSSAEEKELLALMPKSEVDIVPHPVYDMFAGQGLSKNEARIQLGLPKQVPILLFFGIVREYKGLQDLLAALPEVRAQLGELTLVVAGEFWDDKQVYLEMIRNLGISDSVVIHDRYIANEEVPLYFSAADALVAPYRRATGSGVVQLALGCKCPIITTEVSNLAQVVSGSNAGIVTQPADSAALASSIITYFHSGYHQDGVEPTEHAAQWAKLVDAIQSATIECA